MALKIVTASDIASGNINILVYGASGIGKTRLATTMKNPLILSVENGTLSLVGTDIPIAPINTWRDFLAAKDELYAMQEASKKQSGQPFFDWLVIDSLTELTTKLLRSFAKLGGDGRQAYKKMQDEIIDVILSLRDIFTCNILFIAHETLAQDEDGVMRYKPLFDGQKLSYMIPYRIDNVMRMESATVKTQEGKSRTVTYLRCRHSDKATAKERSGKLKEIEPPHMEYVVAKMRGQPIDIPEGYSLKQ